MDRRTLLKTGGTGLMGLLGLGLGACSRTSGLSSLSPRLRLTPVNASWDRVVRTTVGLRPYRASGFVLRARRLDGKTLIHPSQIEVANTVFAPEEAAVAQARDVIDAFADPANAGKGVLKVNGKMTELLHLEEARRIVAVDEATKAMESA